VSELSEVRIDKWLWAARFFKTRGLAADACGIGRIEVNGIRAKASRDLRVGDKLKVTNEGGTFSGEVLGLTEARGSAVVAAELFRETGESKALRAQVEAERKMMMEMGGVLEGRPSKKDRRLGAAFKGRVHRF
jgi:ribosome-associated heat shock protein Hsp15